MGGSRTPTVHISVLLDVDPSVAVIVILGNPSATLGAIQIGAISFVIGRVPATPFRFLCALPLLLAVELTSGSRCGFALLLRRLLLLPHRQQLEAVRKVGRPALPKLQHLGVRRVLARPSSVALVEQLGRELSEGTNKP